jgi:hypothetical protein
MDYYKGNKLFGGVYSRDNLPKKCESKFYIINLNKQHEKGSHWVAVMSFDRCYYFDSFGVYPPPEIETFMKSSGKNIITNIYRIQALNSIKCGYFCIYMIDEMCKGRKFYDVLLDFDPNDFKLNDNLI